MASLSDLLAELQRPSSAFGPVRLGSGPITQALSLGPLAALPGTWGGTGFNSIWRPLHGGNSDHFLQLNFTTETLTFTAIPAPVPDRGLLQPDINLFGLHYLQQIFDANGDSPYPGGALHLEPGLWMVVPATADPENPASTLVRMSSIPHGNAMLAQGDNPGATPAAGPPNIPPVSPAPGVPGITPFEPPGVPIVFPEQTIANDVVQPPPPGVPPTNSNGPFPASMQALVNDPNQLLRDAIAGQDILSTTTFTVTTEGAGSGIENIPFLGTANAGVPLRPANANAFVQQVTATFWLETVRLPPIIPPVPLPPAKPEPIPLPVAPPGLEVIREIEPFWEFATFVQLQYSQTVLLNFNGLLWPHVSVATLKLNSG